MRGHEYPRIGMAEWDGVRIRLQGDVGWFHAVLQMPNNERMRALQSEVRPVIDAVIREQGKTNVGSA